MKSSACSLKPLLHVYQKELPLDWAQEFGRSSPLWVEIGFGLGEVLIDWSKKYQDKNFIGFEQNGERITRALRSIDLDGGRSNVRLMDIDARFAMERFFNQRSIEKIFSLFPCPWPKRGHTRHRLFSEKFMKLLNSRLVDQGILQIVTDSKNYFDWIVPQAAPAGFKVQEKVIAPQFNTKFERKWRKRGQQEFYELNLEKVEHHDIVFPVLTPMKKYTVEQFDPARFKFEDIKGDFSIIFKEILSDPEQKRSLVRVVVSEEHLSQHFWVEIFYKNKVWHVGASLGQHFFQTPGVQRAVERVYESILSSAS